MASEYQKDVTFDEVQVGDHILAEFFGDSARKRARLERKRGILDGAGSN